MINQKHPFFFTCFILRGRSEPLRRRLWSLSPVRGKGLLWAVFPAGFFVYRLDGCVKSEGRSAHTTHRAFRRPLSHPWPRV